MSLVLSLTACGGGNPSTGGTQPTTVSVTASATTLDPTDSVTLTATVSNATGVTWTVSGGGTLSNTTSTTATYTAPVATASPQTITVTATSVSDPTVTGTDTLTVPAALVITTSSTQSMVGTVGSAFSAQLQSSGGIPPYTWTQISEPGDALPPCISLSGTGLLTTTSGNPPNLSCAGAYTAAIQVSDSGTPNALKSSIVAIGVTINAGPYFVFTGAVPSSAVVNEAYAGGSAAATGGVGALTYTVSSGALPTGITLSATTAAITGTPTATGTFNFTITVADAYGESLSQSYTIVVTSSSQTGNSNLKGTYSCLSRGYYDQYEEPDDMIFSFVADGQGNILSGTADNAMPPTELSGTISGSYSVSPNNNGTATITETIVLSGQTGQTTSNWAFALSNTASPAKQLRMLQIDTATANGSTHGTANCYLDNTAAFAAATLNNSFVLGMSGQYQPGATEATAEAVGARFTASSGNIANGFLETATGGNGITTQSTFTGSFGTLNTASGRVPVTLNTTSGNLTFVFYLIDSTHALALETTPYPPSLDIEAGEALVQQQNSWSTANLSGPLVFYTQGTQITNAKGYSLPSGYYSQVLQATANGNGEATINRTYLDDNGTYQNSGSSGSAAISFDPNNPGRAQLIINGFPVSLYFFNSNEAIEVGINNGSIETGWLEAQTQTTLTAATTAGTYLVGQLPLLSSTQTGSTGEFIFGPNNLISGTLTTAGQGDLISAAPVNMSYAWDTVDPASGTFTLSGSLGSGSSSCAVISSTKLVCTPQSDPSPYLIILQQ